MRKASFSLVVVVAAAILAAVAARGSDHGNSRVIHIQEHVTNATYVPVSTLVGGNGPSQGDYIAFDDPIFDPATGNQVGHVAGVCTLVDVSTQIYYCPPAIFFLAGRGQIVAGGLFDGTGNPTTGPILFHGGTGEFREAQGTVKVQALNAAVNDFVFTLSN